MKFSFNNYPWPGLAWPGLTALRQSRPNHQYPAREPSGSEYDVRIPQGRHRASGHVEVSHQEQYSIQMINDGHDRCDARVEIEGKLVGTWRIPPCSTVEVERPVNDTGRFTFYRFDSAEARRAGLRDTEDLGLITVTFMPEMPITVPDVDRSKQLMFSNRRGGTGLSGASNQRFVTVENIVHDQTRTTTIHLRLIARTEGVRPLHSVTGKPPVIF